MGGKRIAAEVRRALVTAAKTMPIVVAIDATGCVCPCSCAEPVNVDFRHEYDGYVRTGGASADDRDARSLRDARPDGSRATDAGKDAARD